MASTFGRSFVWSVTTPTTNLGTWQTVTGGFTNGLLEFERVVGKANLIGATGGTLDIVIQTNYATGTPDGNNTGTGFWTDMARFNQLAAGASAIAWTVVFTRGGSGTSSAPVSVNTVDGTPTIAVNTVNPQTLGDAIRLLVLPGAGTTVGAALTFAFDASP